LTYPLQNRVGLRWSPHHFVEIFMFNMAKCGHCGKTGTKISQIEPNGGAYKQSAICCMSCNSILGITGALLHKSVEGRTSPIPRQTYPMASVTGMPRAV
jgi:hypothetical protein